MSYAIARLVKQACPTSGEVAAYLKRREINGTIGKAIGWTSRKTSFLEKIATFGAKWITRSPEGVEYCGFIPNYSGDLNAMHSAEQHLSDEQYVKYQSILGEISGHPSNTNSRQRAVVGASAEKRAEAFATLVMRHGPLKA